MNEIEARQAVVAEALSWQGTPFAMNQMVKGSGVDCLRLVWRCFCDAGVIPDPGGDPWPKHSDQQSQHSSEEIYIGYVTKYAKEIEAPKPASIVLVKRGIRYGTGPEDLIFTHAGIVTEWPKIIQVFDREVGVRLSNINSLLRLYRDTKHRFFDVWAK